jgi:Fe-S-cluster containining protein
LLEPITYKCINCGFCCNHLLIERQGVRKGLPLLPEEIDLFRKDQVRPGYGVGKSPRDLDFKIIAYQMRLNSCPHRRLGGCSMHAYRPAICRSYPFVPVIEQDNRVVKTFDMTCTTLKDHIKDYPNNAVPVMASSLDVENEYYQQVAAITERLLKDLDEAWFYNLKTEQWTPFKKMMPTQVYERPYYTE